MRLEEAVEGPAWWWAPYGYRNRKTSRPGRMRRMTAWHRAAKAARRLDREVAASMPRLFALKRRVE